MFDKNTSLSSIEHLSFNLVPLVYAQTYTLLRQLFFSSPGKLRIVHTNAPISGAYLADPIGLLNFGESASLGTGTMTSTWLAIDWRLNCDLA